ncbi:MAG: tyrosine-type recombinase/integrase [Clostridiales bacterium]|nr:tyrosine-type recombinase/integrase [Clostridiales bacterium]
MQAGEAWNNPDNLVFTNELGEHLKHVTAYKNFKRIVKDLDLKTTRFHDLRHTYAVTSLQSGDDVKTVQENLGHHTAAFTLDIYGHVSERMKQDSANRMEQFIQGIKNGKEAAAVAG